MILRSLALPGQAVKHVIGVSDWNKRYLNAKRDWGHKLSDEDIE